MTRFTVSLLCNFFFFFAANKLRLYCFYALVKNICRNFFVWEVSRGKEFSPLKNADSVGKDCLKTCKRDLQAEHRRWLAKAGATIEGDGHIFIHPLKSYIGEVFSNFLC